MVKDTEPPDETQKGEVIEIKKVNFKVIVIKIQNQTVRNIV